MNLPKKIFNKFTDFRNNKLLNAKVNLPNDREHIANKEYVDKNNTYDTDKVTQFKQPFKLDWVTNPLGKTIKNILDDVFFPLLLPNYVEPNFQDVQIKLNSNHIIFYDTLNTFTVSWNTEYGDRLSSTRASVNFKDNLTTSSYPGTTTNKIDSINFSHLVKGKTTSIVISRDFNATTVTKQNSYGEDYVPDDMKVPKTITYNLFNHFKRNNIIFSDPILYCNQDENIEQFTTIDDFNKTSGNINVSNNINGNKIYLLIPKLLENYWCYINNDLIDLKLITGSNSEKTLNSTYKNNIVYLVYKLDLGYYQTNQLINIEFYANETDNIQL